MCMIPDVMRAVCDFHAPLYCVIDAHRGCVYDSKRVG